MWLGGSHSRFQFLLSHFAPLLAAGAEPSQDRSRASFPPAPPPPRRPPSSPLHPILRSPRAQCGKYEFPLSFLGKFRSSSFSSNPLRPPLPPPAPPRPAPRPARPLRPWESRRSSGQPRRSAARPPPAAAAAPAPRPPNLRSGLRAARGGRARAAAAAACSPPGRSAPPAGSGEPMVPGTATRSRRRARLPGAELGPTRS